MISFDRKICGNLAECGSREWIESNGIGGYGSSSICGVNTRRYHGLLVAATNPPVERMLLLSKIEETLILDGHRYDLSTNQYPGAVHPEGYKFLKNFRLDPYPVSTFEVNDIEVEKRIFLIHGENTAVITYQFKGLRKAKPCEFELRPLIAFRNYHAITHRNDALNAAVEMATGVVSVKPYEGLPRLYFAHDAQKVEPEGFWYFNFEYKAEQNRGFYENEDLFSPFVAGYPIRAGATASLIVSTEKRSIAELPALHDRELQRRRSVAAASCCADPLITSLVAAADQFVVRRGDLQTIIAGYHWFGDWGRDAMIALPGLTIATGRFETARNVLLAFTRNISQGMLPNYFPDNGELPHYNSVDAALWMFDAVREYLVHSDDWGFIRGDLYDVLGQVISHYSSGTRFGITVGADGLLVAGEAGTQLTWMDAKVGNWVVTPRHGKPVEVQALWYNALRIMEHIATQCDDQRTRTICTDLAHQAQISFNQQFWNQNEGCLYDVVDGEQRDASLRPNQIFAVSLSHSMLDGERARSVMATVERELLTPVGLRTLSPKDSRYCGLYEGGAVKRDAAYHQGTVWPWLVGPFFTAWLKVNRNDRASRNKAKVWLERFRQHLHDAGVGQVSEIFDGDFPHQPRGCVAQAWSVAELLRLEVALQKMDSKTSSHEKKATATGADQRGRRRSGVANLHGRTEGGSK